jgi:small subunit ribosomal protein S11
MAGSTISSSVGADSGNTEKVKTEKGKEKGKKGGKATAGVRVRKKTKRNVPTGKVYINASFNNTIITITDPKGDALVWSTAGKSGFKGSRKSTPFAAQVAAETAGKYARDELGMKRVAMYVSGPGPGRDSAIKIFIQLGYEISTIDDITGLPHNGCRPPKKRRI